jgi:hypothetical protein
MFISALQTKLTVDDFENTKVEASLNVTKLVYSSAPPIL